jgi:hypothetical protein
MAELVLQVFIQEHGRRSCRQRHNPPGWNLEDPGGPGFIDAVSRWAADKHISAGLRQLDLPRVRWTRTNASPVGRH